MWLQFLWNWSRNEPNKKTAEATCLGGFVQKIASDLFSLNCFDRDPDFDFVTDKRRKLS